MSMVGSSYGSRTTTPREITAYATETHTITDDLMPSEETLRELLAAASRCAHREFDSHRGAKKAKQVRVNVEIVFDEVEV